MSDEPIWMAQAYADEWWALDLEMNQEREPGESQFWCRVYHEMWKAARQAFGVRPDPESVRNYQIGTRFWVRYTSGVVR